MSFMSTPSVILLAPDQACAPPIDTRTAAAKTNRKAARQMLADLEGTHSGSDGISDPGLCRKNEANYQSSLTRVR